MASPGERVEFASENARGPGQGYLFPAPPSSPPSTRGLIVVHEWWGVNQQIRAQAAHIAAAGGFTVLVPDVYRGQVTQDYEEAGHLMSGLDWPGAAADVQGAAQMLLARGCTAVGITGFCMGGAISFVAAARIPEISAAAPFYGIPPGDTADLTAITVPVQAHFGSLDHVVGLSAPVTYNPLRQRLTEAGVRLEFLEYEAGHGFTNTESPGYNAECAKLAIGRMCDFMNKHL